MDKRLPGQHCREPMTAALVLMTATALSRVRTSCSATNAPCACNCQLDTFFVLEGLEL
jgi:hypothetical protein